MKIGIVGYGQLARMLYYAGLPLGLDFNFLCTTKPEKYFSPESNVYSLDNVDLFLTNSDAISFETENIPWKILNSIKEHPKIYPSVNSIKICQDRFLEKSFLCDLGIKTAAFYLLRDKKDVDNLPDSFEFPLLLKTTKGGYDGKGQAMVKSKQDILDIAEDFNEHFILEQIVDFDTEVSIVGTRDKAGHMVFYPITENSHKDGILRTTVTIDLPEKMIDKAKSYLKRICEHLNYVGTIALELFVEGDKLIANEIAPRVHNSGHWSIDGTNCSQFENHVRAISSLPLKEILFKESAMINIIGNLPDLYEAMAIPEVHVHLYHKEEKPKRKLGHITATGNINENLSFINSLCDSDTRY
jgi:5-(carboxyamino)imidazole ribonucleotide synthase